MKSILVKFVNKLNKHFFIINSIFFGKHKLVQLCSLFVSCFILSTLSHSSYANNPSGYGPCINKKEFIECYIPSKEISANNNNSYELKTDIAKNTISGVQKILNDFTETQPEIGLIIDSSQINALVTLNNKIEQTVKGFNDTIRTLRELYDQEEFSKDDLWPDAYVIHIGFKGLNTFLNGLSKKFPFLPQSSSWYIGYVMMPSYKFLIAKNDMTYKGKEYKKAAIVDTSWTFSGNGHWILWSNLDFGVTAASQATRGRIGGTLVWNLDNSMTTAKDFSSLGGAGGSFSIKLQGVRNFIAGYIQSLTNISLNKDITPANLKFGGLYSIFGDPSGPVIPQYAYLSLSWGIFDKGSMPTEFPVHINVCGVFPLFDLIGKVLRLTANEVRSYIFKNYLGKVHETQTQLTFEQATEALNYVRNSLDLPTNTSSLTTQEIEIIETVSPIGEEEPLISDGPPSITTTRGVQLSPIIGSPTGQ